MEHHRNFGVEVRLGAEAAPDVRTDHPEAVHGQVEHVGREPASQGLEHLAGGVQGVAPVRGIVAAEVGARLDRASRDPGGADVELAHVGGAGEGGAHHRGVAEGDDVGHVGLELRVEHGALGGERFAHVGERGQLLVVDLHRLRRVLGLRGVAGDDRRDRVADVAHAIAGEDPAHRAVHRPPVVEGHLHHGRDQAPETRRLPLLRGEHAEHSGHRARFAGREARDAGMPVGASHEGGMGGAGGEDVVDVAPPAGQESVVLVTGQGLADVHGGLQKSVETRPCWRRISKARSVSAVPSSTEIAP